jgi:PAS domain S-box-containing protein
MSTPLRVLILEDQPADAELLLHELRRAGFDPTWQQVATEADYLGQLEKPFEVILADYTLPQFDALRALHLLQARGRDIPFIVVTGAVGDEVAAACIKQGATDYLLKDRLARLGQAVTHALQEKQLRAEKQQAEAALLESAEQYRLLFDSNPHPMWVFDQETLAFLAVNAAAVRQYGYSRKEFLAMTIKDIRPPEDVPILLDYRAKRVNQPTPSESSLTMPGLWRHRKKDGTLIDVEITHSPISLKRRDAQLVLANDITERKRAEGKLRESEARFRQMAESIQEVFWMTDLDKNQMIYVSPSYEKIWDRTCESLYQQPQSFLDAIHLDDREHVISSLGKQRQGDFDEVYRIVRPDGSARWIRDRAFPIRDESGHVYRMAGIAEVITERKQLEVQFLQSQKMDAIGRLAGGVAHDFNNLLTAIIGYSQLLLDSLSPSDPRRSDAEQIKGAGERAATLTRQLLAFSRKQVLQQKVLNLNEVIADMEKLRQRMIGEDIDLTILHGPTLGYVKADPGQIEQVLMNLAINARDAMPQGGRLIIETANVDLDDAYAHEHASVSPGGYVRLTVSDNGCGMDAEVRAHLFEPFFTTKAPGEGTGLGLATVYGIVKQTGGHIYVYSEPGHGTTFKIYLPRAEESAELFDPTVPIEAPARGSETVLLVEDDDAVRTLARDVLKRNGYRVLEARQGAEALRICQQRAGAIHLMVTDMIMKGMNGYELAKRVTSRYPEIKVLYISGYTSNVMVHQGVLEPGVTLLQKPFTPDALARKVRELLDQHPSEVKGKGQ